MDKSIKPFIVPVFIPNQGCPHRCIFCDQRRITGGYKIRAKDVRNIIEVAIKSKNFRQEHGMEVAFYGGTFTNLPITYIKELLAVIREYVRKGIVKRIRVSTRPDSIDKHVLSIMKAYNVETVELGAQSFDDSVLAFSKRGHSAKDTIEAFSLLKEMGFKIGIQLMPGLPGDNKEVFMDTIKKTLELRPDMVRLYPTVVIRGTELEELYKRGEYKPLSLEQAVDICTDALIMLGKDGIPVIRIGLMNSESLQENIIDGPWHPAFGFLVRSRAFIKKNVIPLIKCIRKKQVNILAYPNHIPLIRGYKNLGLKMIESETGIKILNVFPDKSNPVKVEEG